MGCLTHSEKEPVVTPELVTKALDKVNVGVVIIDADNNIVFFNKLAGELLHQEPELRVGTSVLLCHPARAELSVLDMIGKMKLGEIEKYEGWINYRGHILYEYIYPLHDEDGRYIGAVDELHDVPEKLEAQKKSGVFKMPELAGEGESTPRHPT